VKGGKAGDERGTRKKRKNGLQAGLQLQNCRLFSHFLSIEGGRKKRDEKTGKGPKAKGKKKQRRDSKKTLLKGLWAISLSSKS